MDGESKVTVFVLRTEGYDIVFHTVAATDTLLFVDRFEKLGAKRLELGKGYSAEKHPAHVPGCREHLHVYRRRNQLFALNVDGSAHDDSHGTTIPKHVVTMMGRHFPEFNVPRDGKIAAFELDLGEPNDRVVAGFIKTGSRSTDAVMLLELAPDTLDGCA